MTHITVRRFTLLLILASSISAVRAQNGTLPSDLQLIEGRVVRQGTSDPIAGAAVALVRLNPNTPDTPEAISLAQGVASLMQSPAASQPGFIEGFLNPNAQRIGVEPSRILPLSLAGAVSDAMGNFIFKDLGPGRYSLSVKRDGYFAPAVGGYTSSPNSKIIDINVGKRPAALEVSLIKGGIISGRVRDPMGQPITGMGVEANQLWYPNGRATLTSQFGNITNDRGEFRIFWLPPGQYFLEAHPRTSGTIAGERDSGTGTDVRPQDSWARTFHPNASDPAVAVPITIKDGDEITGIDIDVRALSTRTYSISGIALNPVPNLPANAASGAVIRSISSFFLVPKEPSLLDDVLPPQFANAIPASSRPNGEFEIRNVRPGAYDLYPSYVDYTAHRYYLALVPVDVRSSDISGLTLSLSIGSTLMAEVVVEETPQPSQPPIKLDSVRLNLSTLGSTPGVAGTVMTDLQFDANGKLTARNIPESRYSVSLTGLSPKAYIADVRQGGRSVYDEGVDIGTQPKAVQIIVHPEGASIAGTVRSADQKPEQTLVPNADVILVPSPERRQNAGMFKVVTTDSEGRFSMAGVMPGAYTIFALKDRPFREPWLNADFLAKYKDRWTSINVETTSSATVQLEVLPN